MATKSDRMEQLSSKQRIAISALASGLSDTEASKIASVNRSTLNQWKLHNVRFKQALAIESNIIREESIKAAVGRFKRLKDASYKTILDGIERGCLVTARWYLEKTCLESDLKMINKVEQLSQLQDEDVNSIMETMAKGRVTEYLDMHRVDQLERIDIEESMIRKVTARLIEEFNNKELENE